MTELHSIQDYITAHANAKAELERIEDFFDSIVIAVSYPDEDDMDEFTFEGLAWNHVNQTLEFVCRYINESGKVVLGNLAAIPMDILTDPDAMDAVKCYVRERDKKVADDEKQKKREALLQRLQALDYIEEARNDIKRQLEELK